MVKLNATLNEHVISTKTLLWEYNIFAWTYIDLKGIPLHIVQQYRIEFNTTILHVDYCSISL